MPYNPATRSGARLQTACPTDDDLLALAQGLFREERAAGLRAHVAACVVCSASVAEAARCLESSAAPARDEPRDELPATTAREDTLSPGARLGRYSILELLGKGAMGAVYAAYDPQLDRRVALKVLRPDRRGGAGDAEMQQRLLREAQAMARLHHPNVLAIYDAVSFEGGVFLAMDLVAGGTLRAWLGRAPRSPAEILAVFRQAGEGLAAAHRAGIVHRDFKADNVLLDEAGRVYVTDFGVARLGTADAAARPGDFRGLSLTQSGAMVGTPAYMAPEQLRGEPADARSDIFGFCVALYEALYGAHPFPARDLAELKQVIGAGRVREPPPVKGVPAQVQRAVLRGLALAPAGRFQTMDELLAALSWKPRRRARIALAAAGVALAGGAIFAARSFEARRLEACRRGDGRLERVFDEPRQAAVQKAFAQSGFAAAATAFASAREGLMAAVRAIAKGRADACSATHERGEASAELLDRRMQCLDERLQDSAALVDAFAAADATTVEKAVTAVQQLRDPAACADRRALLDASPLPADAAARARITRVREQVAELAALHRLGHYQDALARSAAVVEAAQATHYAPLESEALYWRARAVFDGNQQTEAPAILTAAAAAAVRASRDDLAAQAESQLVYTLGWAQKLDEALRWAEHARAIIARRGGDPLLLADLLLARGYARMKVFRSTEALPDNEQALALLEKHAQNAPVRIVQAMQLLAVVLDSAGRGKEALALAERALPLAEATLGPIHPMTLSVRGHLAIALFNTGEFRRALPILQRTLADRRAALGPDHLDVAKASGALGSDLETLGDQQGAADAYAEATAIVARKLGGDHPELIGNLALRAEPLARLGRFDEAYATLARAEALARKHQGEKSAMLGFILEARATVLEIEGRAAEAARAFEASAALIERAVPGHPDVEACKRGAARQWRRMGRAREAAAAHAALLADAAKRPGATARDLADPRLDLGEDLLALDRPLEARPHLERALEALDPAELDPLVIAEVRFAVARALWADAAGRPRALELARQAQAAVVASPLQRGTLRADLRRWLAGKPAR